MDTKLRSLTEDKKEWIWSCGLVLCTEMAIFARIFFHYRKYDEFWSARGIRFYEVASDILLLASILFGIVLIWELFRIRKVQNFTGNFVPFNPKWIRKIPAEVLTAAVIFCAWAIYITLDSHWYWFAYAGWYYAGICLWGRFVLNTFRSTLLFGILLFLTITIFYGSLYQLYCRVYHKTWKDTCLIYTTYMRYRTRTPLERKLQHRHRGAWLLIVGLTAGIMVVVIDEMQYMAAEKCALIFVLLFFILAVYWKTNISGKLLRDIGHLTEQIHALSTGETPDPEQRLPENSLLYPAQGELEHIDAAISRSVEKQMQAERLKVDLITNMSHDLKTPLTSMVGYTDLLKKENLSPEAMDYVNVISVKQEQLKNMIQDLFDLSKATSGIQQLVLETLDMRRLLEQTMGNMEDSIENSGLTIRSRFPNEPLLFVGDNEKMYRVVQNLLENALKYSLPGTRIYLEAGRAGGNVWMQMKNIASYEMEFAPDEIMERFVRGDQSRTTEGHGLGLAIASSFVQNMKGTMKIEVDGDMFKIKLEFPEADKGVDQSE